MEGRSTIAWGPVSFWMVKLSGADRLKAHKSSDVCSEQMPAAQAQKGTQVAQFTTAST